jgi:hypothetical protein
VTVAREDGHATDGTRTIAAIASHRAGRPINRNRCQRLMREHRLLQPVRSEGRRRRPGYFQVTRPDELWAAGHDQRLGRRARLDLLERRDRLLHTPRASNA